MTERDLSAQHALLAGVAGSVEERFQAARRVLSFAEYLELFATDPRCHSRDASRYLRDVFDHYGTREVERPWGKLRRAGTCSTLPWETAGDRKGALVGHEEVQEEIHRAIANFAREGRPNRLVLLHGPNGSAKSTIVSCVIRALENYSTLQERRALPVQLGLPVEQDGQGRARFRRR